MSEGSGAPELLVEGQADKKLQRSEKFSGLPKAAIDRKSSGDMRHQYLQTRDALFSQSGSQIAKSEFSTHKVLDATSPRPSDVMTSSLASAPTFSPRASPRPSPRASPRASPRVSPRASPKGSPRNEKGELVKSGTTSAYAPTDPLFAMLKASQNPSAAARKPSIDQGSMGEQHVIPFAYKGLIPCKFVERLVKSGESVRRGSEMAIVEIEDDAAGMDAPTGYAGYGGYTENDDAAADSARVIIPRDSATLIDLESNYAAESASSSQDDQEAVLMLVWEGDEGVVQEWLVEPGQVLEPGQVIARVLSSVRLAHLIKADEYARQMRSERTDWNSGLNARFQDLTENLVRAIASGSREVVHSEETLKTCTDLERVARDFMDTARTYGKVIISEMHLPVEAKTVRPLKLGGVLGGSKYVVRDVLFKLGDGDVFSEYPDPLYIANKIQGHELKGLKSYFAGFFNAGTLGTVSFPLMAIIDFKGHRITAMSELPINGKESLILGSMDAGSDCNVMNKDEDFSRAVNSMSARLGLKPHYVINGKAAGGSIEITHCVDLEGHLGKDGKKYLLDFSRTFPPAYKDSGLRSPYDKSWPFYHMFRAEFLYRYQVFNQLSSDAYSMFQCPRHPEEKLSNHRDIKEATTFVCTQVVQNVCLALKEMTTNLTGGDFNQRLSLSHIFHREGLNMRYLGLVYAKLVHEMYAQTMRNVYKEIIAESLMRTLKNHLRSCLRGADGESNQLSEARSVLNAFFGQSSDEIDWVRKNPFVMQSLTERFNFEPRDARHVVVTFRSNSSIVLGSATESITIKYVVLKRLSESTGLEIDPEVMMDLKMMNGSIRGRGFESQGIFEDLDFAFTERVKQLDVIQRAFGLAQYLKGVRLMRVNPAGAEQFLLRGFFMVEKVLEAAPLDPWLMALMGDLSSALWLVMQTQARSVDVARATPELLQSINESIEVAGIFSARAERYYQESVSAAPLVPVLRNFAVFMLRHERVEEAESLLRRAMAACHAQGGTLSGQLVSEWELIAEIEDLMAECNLLRAGGMRKASIQVAGAVAAGARSSPAGSRSRRASVAADSFGAKVKRTLRRKKPSVSVGDDPIAPLRKSNKSPVLNMSSGLHAHSEAPTSPSFRATDSFGIMLRESGSFEMRSNEQSEKSQIMHVTARNKALLERLRGAHE